MKHETAFDRFLLTDPRDVGCEEAMEILHVYVELVAADAAAEERYPGFPETAGELPDRNVCERRLRCTDGGSAAP